MKKKATELVLVDDKMIRKIFMIRGEKIMLDRDLAELYSVETFRLNEGKEILTAFQRILCFN
jgi:hypothetical protein